MRSAPTGLHRTRRFGLVCLTGVALAASPTPAAAQDPVEPPPASSTFDATALGFGESLDFRGHTDTITLTLPVPDGLRPDALDTTAQLPVDIARGWIDVESEGRLISRLDLPPNESAVPLSIPLADATVDDGAAVVTVRLHLDAVDNICPETWTWRSVQLRNSAIRYSGTPTPPALIADFLPPILDRLDLYLTGNPTDTESTVALDLTAAVTARYHGTGTRVVVQELPENGIPPAADTPFVRQIVIDETGDPGALLGNIPDGPPALYLTGNSDTLLDQARIVTSELSGLAVATDAAAAFPNRPARLSPDTETLDELRIGTLEDSALGGAEVHLYLDQTRFGRPVEGLRVDLSGAYTPLPETEGGLITVRAGDTVLDSWAADGSGIIDRVVDVPDSALRRVTDLSVSLRTTGAQQACGLQQPVTVRIDGDTRISSTLADRPVPPGFESLPQSLMPHVDVAATDSDLDATARAVDIIAGLQSLTAVQLEPQWVPLEDAVESNTPTVLVAPDGQVPDSLDLPLVRTEDRRFDITGEDGNTASLTFGTEVDFASLQVMRDNDRALLVAMSTAVPAELDRTLTWLAAEPGRWAQLDGNVLFTAPERDPVTLSDPAGETDAVAADSDDNGTVTAIVVAAAVLAVIAAVGAGVWAMMLRRRRPRPR